MYHPVRICDDCFQKLYPEEAARKIEEATNETTATKSNDAIEMNFYDQTKVNESTQQQQQEEITTTKNTSHQMLEKPNLLKNLTDGCQVSGVNNEIDENTSPQNESKSVLPNSDIKNVVLTNDTPNEVLEGEACVVLNTNSNQS